MDIDRRLHEAGQRWRESQGPALRPPSPGDVAEDAPPRRWRKGLAPLAAAAAVAAVAAIVFAIVGLHGTATNGQQVPVGALTTHPPSVTSSVPKPSTSTSSQPSNAVTAPPARAAACLGSQLRPSLGASGPAGGAGHTQILLQNVSGQACHLGGVLPLQGVYASGTTTRLVFPGPSNTAYPSPVAPGTVAAGDFGALWVSTQLNGCPNGARFASLDIELSAQQHVQMPWPVDLSNGCLAAESAAGPFPQPTASIP
jgi:hypothetical protein